MLGKKKATLGKIVTHKVWWPKINHKQMLAIKDAIGFYNLGRMTPELEELMILAASRGHLKFEEVVADPQKKDSRSGYEGWIRVYFDKEETYFLDERDLDGDDCLYITNHPFYGDEDRVRFNTDPDYQRPGKTYVHPLLAPQGIPTFSATFHTDWLKSFLALE